MKTFKHSGDLGDIIYSLALIKRIGGGTLLLDTTGGVSDFNCNTPTKESTKFTKQGYEFIKPLIEAQSYINECREWQESDSVDINLNEFRQTFTYYAQRGMVNRLNLLNLYFDQFGYALPDPNEPWLFVDNKKLYEDGARFVALSRTPRCQSAHIWFETHCKRLEKEAFFVGLDKEHEYFEWTFGVKLPHQKVDNALTLAEYVNGSKLTVANSSLCLAIAVGLGTVYTLNECFPTTMFPNKRNMMHLPKM